MDGSRTRSARAGVAAFLAPRLPPSLIERPRLVGELGIDHRAAWTIVVGPPGCGKTTLVRTWMAARDGSWAWISLTSARYREFGIAEKIVRAVQAARPGAPLDTVDDIGDAAVGDVGLVDHLADELTGDDVARTVLVIDDTHLLSGDEWELLHRLIVQLPPSLHLVVVGRTEPPLALGRERATGRVATVRADALAFDLSETAALLESITGTSSDATARSLHEVTEGWAVGVRLAALAIRDGADAEDLLAGLGRRTSTVAEFLVEEVLDRLPAQRREVLACLSSLRLLEPELCDAITGRTDSSDILRDLAADGSFVVAVDGVDDRYRFHPLLASLLQFELQRDDPERARAAHLTAADWLLVRDRPIESIEHLLAAGEHERAHGLLMDHFRPLYIGSHRHDIDRWLTAIPDDVITATPARALDHCVALALIAHDQAAWWHRYCAAHVPSDDDWLTSRMDAIDALNHIVNGRLAEARASWRRSEARRPPDRTEPIDEVLRSWDVRLGAILGDPEAAVAAARRLQDSHRELVGDAPALSVLAGALAAAGDHETATAVAERAIETWRRLGEPDLPGMVDALVVAAADARRSGELDAADQLLDAALTVVPDWAPGPNALTMIPLVERARVAHDRGDPSWRTQLVGVIELMRAQGRAAELVEWVVRSLDELDRAKAPTQVPRAPSSGVATVEPLTDRELMILQLLASHLSLPEIGTELFISRHTVKSHVTNIYRKLGASSRSEAVRTARELQLLD